MRTLLIAIAMAVLTLSSTAAMAADRALGFAVGGVVAEVKVKVGQRVKAGDVLAVLDLRAFQAEKRAADAAHKATKSIFDIAVLRHTQTVELFDALSASAEDVQKAEIERDTALITYENARRDDAIAQWNLDRATLRAPFPGTVSAVPGYPGQVVTLMSSPVDVVVINAE